MALLQSGLHVCGCSMAAACHNQGVGTCVVSGEPKWASRGSVHQVLQPSPRELGAWQSTLRICKLNPNSNTLVVYAATLIPLPPPNPTPPAHPGAHIHSGGFRCSHYHGRWLPMPHQVPGHLLAHELMHCIVNALDLANA